MYEFYFHGATQAKQNPLCDIWHDEMISSEREKTTWKNFLSLWGRDIFRRFFQKKVEEKTSSSSSFHPCVLCECTNTFHIFPTPFRFPVPCHPGPASNKRLKDTNSLQSYSYTYVSIFKGDTRLILLFHTEKYLKTGIHTHTRAPILLFWGIVCWINLFSKEDERPTKRNFWVVDVDHVWTKT